MQPFRRILPVLTFAAALGVPKLALAGSVGQIPSPGTYYFVGQCTPAPLGSSCTGIATATWVVGSGTMTFDFWSSEVEVSFTQRVQGGSTENPPTGFARVVIVGGNSAFFNTFDLGKWEFGGPDTPNAEGVNGMWSTTPIPEPATYALVLMGLGALAVAARRRKSRQPGA